MRRRRAERVGAGVEVEVRRAGRMGIGIDGSEKYNEQDTSRWVLQNYPFDHGK